jgi:hypothetical protein
MVINTLSRDPSSSTSHQRPQTPEGERQNARVADRMQRLQMTDPDERRRRHNRGSPIPPLPPVIQQPVFAPEIPQVNIPENLNAPGVFPVPAPVPAIVVNDPFMINLGNNNLPGLPLNNNVPDLALGNNNLGFFNIPEVQLPQGWNAPLQNPVPRNVPVVPPAVRRRRTPFPNPVVPDVPHLPHIPEVQLPQGWNAHLQDPVLRNVPVAPPAVRGDGIPLPNPIVPDVPHVPYIPQVQLPQGWNAPLQNPIPRNVPALPPVLRRGRTPLPDLAANPALNNVHRGHIAHRGQIANHQADRNAYLLNQLQQGQRQHADQVQEQLAQQQNQFQHGVQQQANHQRNVQAALGHEQNERQRHNAEVQAQILQRWQNERDADLNQMDDEQNLHANPDAPQFQNHEEQLFQAAQDAQPALDEQIPAAAEPAPIVENEQDENAQAAQPALDEQIPAAAEPAPIVENDQNENPVVPPNILHIPPQGLPKGRAPYQEPSERHILGSMNLKCDYCDAMHFDSEKLSTSTLQNKKFGSCCLQGQVQLTPFKSAPVGLRDLLCGVSPLSKKFRDNIRQYNAAFAFTSLGVKIDHAITNAPGPYSFRINGALHHLAGALTPQVGQPEVYAQLYIHDAMLQLGLRQNNNPNLDHTILSSLQGIIHEVNPYVGLYRQAYFDMNDMPQ